MALTDGTAGAWVATTTRNPTVTLPAHSAGQMLLVRVGWKSSTPTTDVAVCNTAGWAKVGQYYNGGGASSNGGGGVLVAVFWKVAESSSETDPTIEFDDATAPTPGVYCAVSYNKASGDGWETPVGDGGSIAAATSYTGTIQSHVAAASGDMLDAFAVICDNNAMTVPTVAQTGLTLDTVTEYPATAISDATSNDIAADGCNRLATAGTSSAAAVVSGSQAAADAGSAWVTRLRASAPTQKTASDSGTGTDSGATVGQYKTGADSGTGTDTASLAAAVSSTGASGNATTTNSFPSDVESYALLQETGSSVTLSWDATDAAAKLAMSSSSANHEGWIYRDVVPSAYWGAAGTLTQLQLLDIKSKFQSGSNFDGNYIDWVEIWSTGGSPTVLASLYIGRTPTAGLNNETVYTSAGAQTAQNVNIAAGATIQIRVKYGWTFLGVSTVSYWVDDLSIKATWVGTGEGGVGTDGNAVVDTTGGATQKSGADSGVGTDTSTAPTVDHLRTDAGAGSDASAGIALGVRSDSGTGTDTALVTVPISASDSTTGTDAPGALTAALGGALESGAATDTAAAPTVALGGSETGTGTDGGAAIALGTRADSGAATDTATVSVPVLAVDSGIGTDTASLAAATDVRTDAGAGTDAPGVLAAILPTATDAGAGSDVAALAALLDTRTDAGTGTDGNAQVLQGVVDVVASDSGVGTDVSAGLVVQIVSSDSAVATDAAAAIERQLVESGVASDVAALAAAYVSTESGAGSDLAFLTLAVTATDSGVGTDARQSLLVDHTRAEAATGTDVISGKATGTTETAVATDDALLAALLSRVDSGVASDVAIVQSDTLRVFPRGTIVSTAPAGSASSSRVAGLAAATAPAGTATGPADGGSKATNTGPTGTATEYQGE